MNIHLFGNYLKKIYRSSSRLVLTLSGLVLSVIILMSVLIISETLLDFQMQIVNTYKECNGVIADCEFDYNTYSYFKKDEEYHMHMELSSDMSVLLKKLDLRSGDTIPIYGRCVQVDEGWNLNLLPQAGCYDNERYHSKLLYGRMFDINDIKNGEKVIIIDTVTAKILFNKENAIGEIISIQTWDQYNDEVYNKYKVIGIIEPSLNANRQYEALIEDVTEQKRDMDAFYEFNYYVPYSSNMITNGINNYHMYLVFMSEDEHYSDIKYNINNERFSTNIELKINNVIDADYVYQQNAQEISETQSLVLGIMIIVFVISGLCIMNTMMFSVKERINEIGIRKAIGAFYNDILLQFVFEGFIYGLFSGVVGVIFAIVIWSNIYFLFDGLFTGTSKMVVSVETIILSITSAVLISILSSIIPAVYASRIKVSDALKFD